MAHILGALAIIVYVVQRLSTVRIADYLGSTPPWVGLSIGLLIGQIAVLKLRLREHDRAYAARAARKVWYYLVAAGLGQALVASIILIFLSPSPTLGGLATGVGVGLAVAVGPSGFELLVRTLAGRYSWAGRLFKGLHRGRLLVLQTLERRIQEEMATDNFDWQVAEGEWNFGVEARETARRLRKLFETHKLEIANHRRNPALLFSDTGHHPGAKFYPLIRYLGRSRLIERLRARIDPPTPDWDGSERRRTRGGRHDRQNRDVHARRRIYDDERLIERVRRGKVTLTEVQQRLAIGAEESYEGLE